MASIVIVGVLAAVLGYAVRRLSAEEEDWRPLAAALRLTLVGPQRLAGRVDGRRAVVDTVTRGTGRSRRSHLRIVVEAPKAARGLLAAGEQGGSRLTALHGGEDVRVGDPGFDASVRLRGDEADVVGLLASDVRPLLLDFVRGHGGELEDGELRWETPYSSDATRPASAALDAVRSLATALDVEPGKGRERLAKNAVGDPLHGVRLRNFGLLWKHHRGDQATRAVAGALLGDVHPEVRLAAARHLHDERSFEVLRALVRDERSDAALAQLLDGYDYASVGPVLEEVLASEWRAAWPVAIREVGARGDASRRAAIEACLGRDAGEAAELAAAVALGSIGDAASEEVLVGLLGAKSEEVRRAAAESLAVVGTLRSVEPLLACSDGLFAGGALKASAREAVRKIQARAGPADGGRLTVLEPSAEAGALSVAHDGGLLSVVSDVSAATRTMVRG